jgi:hypothetical protein
MALSRATMVPLLLVFCPFLTRAIDSFNITTVECPGNATPIRAQTELVFVGSNDFLGSMERTALANAFVKVYNRITTDRCDSLFRRLERMDFVSMTNQLNETLTYQDTDLLAMLDTNTTTESPYRPNPGSQRPFGRLRSLQAVSVAGVNTSDSGGVTVAFSLTGSCRNCRSTQSGSFQLYDDAARLRFRYLQEQPKLPLRPNNPLGEEPRERPGDGLLLQSWNNSERERPGDGRPLPEARRNTSDCTCAAGLRPERPSAPRIAELIAFVNDSLQTLQSSTQEGPPLFRDKVLANILQRVVNEAETNVAVEKKAESKVGERPHLLCHSGDTGT